MYLYQLWQHCLSKFFSSWPFLLFKKTSLFLVFAFELNPSKNLKFVFKKLKNKYN